jgi:hypothetical protein
MVRSPLPVATVIARSVRPMQAINGFDLANGSFYPSLIIVVFSVPHRLVPLMWQNIRVLFAVLFEASAATLLKVAASPERLGALLGFLSVLQTWGQTLQRHPHIHCVLPGGGLSADHKDWICSRQSFFLPVRVLSRVFRGKSVRRPEATLSEEQASVSRGVPAVIQRKGIQLFSSHAFSQELGRIRQEAVWRSRACLALPGTLHPSRRYLQSPIAERH